MNSLKTICLLILLTILLVLIGNLIGGIQGMLFFFIIALVFNFVTYWFSNKIVLRIYMAKPAPDDSYLTEVVRHVSQMAGSVIL